MIERHHDVWGHPNATTNHGVIDTIPKGTWKTIMYEQDRNGITYFNVRTGESKYYPLLHILNQALTYDHFVSFIGEKGDRTPYCPWHYMYRTTLSYRRRGKVLSSDVALFHNTSPRELCQKGLTSWHEDIHPEGTDTVHIPTMVHSILYDPPGDASVATVEQGQSVQNGLTWSMTNEVGLSYHIGAEGGNDESGSSIDTHLEGGLTIKQEHSDSWTTTVANTKGMNSSIDESDSRYIGPGKGDMFFISPLAIEFKGYKKLKLNYYHDMSNPSAYTYFIASRMLSIPGDVFMSRSISALKAEYIDNPEFLELLQKESAVDIYTGKIKKELIENGRLIPKETLDFVGNSPVSRMTDSTVS